MKAFPGITALRMAAALAVGLAALVGIPAPAAASAAEIKLGASCVTAECHGDLSKAQFLHGPVNMMQCEPCHVSVGGKHEFEKVAQGRDLCVTCHTVEKPMSVVHKPFESDCTVCHQPHGGDNRRFVKGGEGAGSCILCHDSVTQGMTRQHGPVAAGECLVCHSPHQSDHKGLLVDSRASLCLGCHVDVDTSMKGAVAVHKPVAEQCAGCHNPHGGTSEFFLTAEGQDLCMKCHAEFVEKANGAAFPHAPMTEGKSCRNCHAPHASSQTGLLSTNTMDLCLSCHDKTIPRDTGDIENMAAQIAEAEFLHGPVRDKNCAACHQAHGSEHASILKKDFPREFYAPYKEGAYDLCFECHDSALALAESSEGTGFRDGTRNLHFLHVNREKGRTCRACHAEHASEQPHHIRSEVPFGRWSMKVKFTKTETGGTCETGCHVPYSYDRVQPTTDGNAP